MKIIAHRANLFGPYSKSENTLKSITLALKLGFEVEIDVWLKEGKLCLGHDDNNLTYEPDLTEFLFNNASKLWIHCKNLEALRYLLQYDVLNVFGHSNDEFVLTSKRYIFCKPGVVPYENGIIVMPEMHRLLHVSALLSSSGVLTDYPVDLRNESYTKFLV